LPGEHGQDYIAAGNAGCQSFGEREGALPACIGTKPMLARPRYLSENERICYSARSLDADRHDKPLKTQMPVGSDDGAE